MGTAHDTTALTTDQVSRPGGPTRRVHRVGGAILVLAGLGLGVVRLVSDPAPVGSRGAVARPDSGPSVSATVRSASLSLPSVACSDTFEEVDLPHTTVTDVVPARLFDANGNGVAAGDLDDDGLPDLVLANLDGPNSILWNEGEARFTAEAMDDRSTRSVQLVDVDADGSLDIVTSHRAAGVRAFRNLGDRRFEPMRLPGISQPAYAMAWADYDGDGDLDLATGAYDAELDQRLRSSFLFGNKAGVFVYTNRDADDGTIDEPTFTRERLVDSAQALTVAWIDLDLDGDVELIVGNDFATHDMAWTLSGDTWEPIMPLLTMAAHPMSVDTGDVDGDGVEEIFATDMKPMSTRTDILATWMPLIATMDGLDNPADAQRIRNVLLAPRADGAYVDVGNQAGIDAAGWAWSARFADLDNDADLDIHIANGMIAKETFPYLEGAELVERNVTFVNSGRGVFTENEDWGLGSTASGRGSVVTDLDRDGRLDIVVNNLGAPARAYLNDLCVGRSVEIRLHSPDANTAALGATLVVTTPDGRELVRTLRSGAGYLSGVDPVVHVGVGDAATIDLEVRWPDGTRSRLDDLSTDSLHEVTRT